MNRLPTFIATLSAVFTLTLVFTALSFLAPLTAYGENKVRLYLDADMTGTKESGLSIKRGILTALNEVGNTVSSKRIELVVMDHRGNSARSLANLKKFLADPDALALFSGLHSPPLLAHRQFINESGILVLDPWAAAGPITRHSSGKNWIFRLSVDDSKAGGVIVRRAIDERGFKHPALLLENTGWGKSNLKTMTAHLAKQGLKPVKVTWFDWGLTTTGAKILLRDIKKAGADVIFLVANAPEGKAVARAMLELKKENHLPLVSHWGITGGDFPKVINAEMRQNLDLEFIQTQFSFLDMGDAAFPNQVFNEASKLFPEIRNPEDIKAPTGFIHAYDLTRILIAAAEQAGLEGGVPEARVRVRDALESLATPVQGLIRTYDRPFRPYDIADPDAHEALGEGDLTFGRYGADNEIYLIKR